MSSKNWYPQQEGQKINGLYKQQSKVIELFKPADPTTIVHELGHHFTFQYVRLLQNAGKTEELQGILSWLNEGMETQATSFDEMLDMNNAGQFTGHWEKFADAFVTYVNEGIPPSSTMERIFKSLRDWMCEVWKKIVEAGHAVEINDDVRAFFDNMLSVRDGKTETDFRELLGKTEQLRQVVKAAEQGKAIEVDGIDIDTVKDLVKQLHRNIPRKPINLVQGLRYAGGIAI